MSAPANERHVTRLFRVWSRFYDNPVPQRLFYRRVHHRILRRWRPSPGERVLDVGCGTGLFLDQLARDFSGLDLHGLDLSREMLASQSERSSRSSRHGAPRTTAGATRRGSPRARCTRCRSTTRRSTSR